MLGLQQSCITICNIEMINLAIHRKISKILPNIKINLWLSISAVLGMSFWGSSALSTSWITPSNALGTLSKTQEPSAETSNHPEEVEDPLEGLNRVVFQFNQGIDFLLLGPISEIYQIIFPELVRDRVHSVLSNLSSPLVFLNDVAQLDGDHSMETLARFLINTTLGLGGLFDVAGEIFDIKAHTADFGQTLGKYGAEGTPYLVLPIIGPSNGRDLLGMAVDIFADPVNYMIRVHSKHKDLLRYTRLGLESVDKRREANEALKRINEALDPYILMRTLYTSHRRFVVNPSESIDQLDSPTPSSED